MEGVYKMGTKAQLVEYITEHFETEDGMPVSVSKLDSIKKADLEKFIESQDEESNYKEWLATK